MKVYIEKETPVLIPNPNHKNFTHAGSFVEEDSVVEGKPVQIQGRRRGRPHIYKLFQLKDGGGFIHIKNVKPMQVTEVKLGADAQKSPTVVNMKNASSKSNKKWIGAIAGAGLGFAFAKYKKYDRKKQITYAVVAGLAGFGLGYYLEGGASKIKVEPSK